MPLNMTIPFNKSNSDIVNLSQHVTYEDVPISKNVLSSLAADIDWPLSKLYIPLNSMVIDGDIIYYIKQGYKHVKYDTKTDIKTELSIPGFSMSESITTYIYKYMGDGKIYHVYTTGYSSGGYRYIMAILDLKNVQYTKCFDVKLSFNTDTMNYLQSSYSLNRFLLDDEVLFLTSTTNVTFTLMKLSFTGIQTSICSFSNSDIYSPSHITSVYKENGIYYTMCTAQNAYQTPNNFRLFKCVNTPSLIKSMTITVGTVSDYDSDPNVSFTADFVVESPSRKKILLWPNPCYNLTPPNNALLYIEINADSSDFTMEYIPTVLYGSRLLNDEPVFIDKSIDFTQEPNKISDQLRTVSLFTHNDTTSYAYENFHMHPSFFDWNDPMTLYYIFGYREMSESGESNVSDSTACYRKMQYKLPLMRKFSLK